MRKKTIPKKVPRMSTPSKKTIPKKVPRTSTPIKKQQLKKRTKKRKKDGSRKGRVIKNPFDKPVYEEDLDLTIADDVYLSDIKKLSEFDDPEPIKIKKPYKKRTGVVKLEHKTISNQKEITEFFGQFSIEEQKEKLKQCGRERDARARRTQEDYDEIFEEQQDFIAKKKEKREQQKIKRMISAQRKQSEEEFDEKVNKLWDEISHLFKKKENFHKNNVLKALRKAFPASKGHQEYACPVTEASHIKYCLGFTKREGDRQVIQTVPRKKEQGKEQTFTRIYKYNFFLTRKQDGTITRQVNPHWIEDVFDPVFVAIVKKAHGFWIEIPAGDSKNYGKNIPSELLTSVQVKFQQENYNYCIAFSLASVLHYLKKYKAANTIKLKASKLQHLPKNFSFNLLRGYMADACPEFDRCRVYNKIKSNMKKRKIISITELINNKSPFPTLVCLTGADGSVSHAVCIIDDLIFDSTQRYALKLIKESLDWICGESGCVGISEGYCFYHDHNKTNIITKKHWNY